MTSTGSLTAPGHGVAGRQCRPPFHPSTRCTLDTNLDAVNPPSPSLQGDYHRYLAEFKTGAERKEAAEHTLLAYKAAQVRSCRGQVLLLGCGLCKLLHAAQRGGMRQRSAE